MAYKWFTGNNLLKTYAITFTVIQFGARRLVSAFTRFVASCSRHIIINQDRIIGMPEPRRTCGRLTHIWLDLSSESEGASVPRIPHHIWFTQYTFRTWISDSSRQSDRLSRTFGLGFVIEDDDTRWLLFISWSVRMTSHVSDCVQRPYADAEIVIDFAFHK